MFKTHNGTDETTSDNEFQALMTWFEKKLQLRTDTVRDLYSLAQCKECININTYMIIKYLITHYKIRFYMPAV